MGQIGNFCNIIFEQFPLRDNFLMKGRSLIMMMNMNDDLLSTKIQLLTNNYR